jgi:hypothetical protein
MQIDFPRQIPVGFIARLAMTIRQLYAGTDKTNVVCLTQIFMYYFADAMA